MARRERETIIQDKLQNAFFFFFFWGGEKCSASSAFVCMSKIGKGRKEGWNKDARAAEKADSTYTLN